MFEDGLNSREESKINHLINRFNEMLDSDQYYYFDSHDLEKIIDFYLENLNKAKIRDAFFLYEKLYYRSNNCLDFRIIARCCESNG